METGLTIIATLLTLVVMTFKWAIDKDNAKKKQEDDIDQEIDAIESATDVTRLGDKLRDK